MSDIRMLKEGLLAWLLWQGGGRRRRSRSKGQHRSRGLPERRGGRNNKYKPNKASQSITWQYVVPGVT